jgi:hypothetical protein
MRWPALAFLPCRLESHSETAETDRDRLCWVQPAMIDQLGLSVANLGQQGHRIGLGVQAGYASGEGRLVGKQGL